MTPTEQLLSDPAAGSGAAEPAAPNIVQVGEHTVTLHPAVTMQIGIAASYIIRGATDEAVVRAQLADVYLRLGIADWTFPDAINPETIAANLPFADGGLEVAEAADRLYTNEVMRPFRRRFPTLFPTTPPDESTSATNDIGPTPPTPPSPSSPTSSEAGPPSADPAP